MRLGLPLGGFFVGAVLGVGAFAACSVQTSGNGEAPDGGEAGASAEAAAADGGVPDAPADISARMEAQAQEAGPCTGVLCNGQCVAASDCRSCSGAPLLCGATGACRSSCAGCQDTHGTALPIDCFACDSNHQNPIGTCAYDDAGSYCLSGDYTGQYEQGASGYRCGCGDGGACPGATQVCVPLGNYDAGFCLTCGETTVGAMQDQPCAGGGTCQASSALCQ
jgi:hypothetical protein